MKEIILKFSSEEAYNEFIETVIKSQLKEQEENPTTEYVLDYNFSDDVGIIKKQLISN